MNTLKKTFLICSATCVAYEAVRINGWHNRVAQYSEPTGLIELAIGRWEPMALLVYAAIFLPFAAIAFNRLNPKVQRGWYIFSCIALAAVCICIPGAMNGRWVSTHHFIALFYLFIVPIPASIFIAKGVIANAAEKLKRPDGAALASKANINP